MRKTPQRKPIIHSTRSITSQLRFNLIADGQGYDVLLKDTIDKEQEYAVLTDERGLIRECKALQGIAKF